ncbi:hypothetical protein SADUNF_Sadunf16G0176700 [Salix dunnii]|uniref:Uncharacterized protein n=1 Tax=Salix dunnii TaxID=1413687 RepID=A0A835MQJ3_9ROSI|nr:hypothetical protein SADUNF_Sadunf16G0176700 [Salix dunnii]
MIHQVFSAKENGLIVGGSWIMNDTAAINARNDSRGMLVTLLQHKIKSKSKITISSEFDTIAVGTIPTIGSLTTTVITIPNSNSSNEQTNAKDGFFQANRLSFQSYCV